MAKRLGVQTPLQPVPSIGSARSRCRRSTWRRVRDHRRGGMYSEPMAIRKVLSQTARRTPRPVGQASRKRVIAAWVADAVTPSCRTTCSKDGVQANFGRPAAGKTGTTDNHADAWFCGLPPESRGDRLGRLSEGEIPMLDVHGIRSRAALPAQIWHRFMQAAVRYSPVRTSRRPRHRRLAAVHARRRARMRPATDTTSTGVTTTRRSAVHAGKALPPGPAPAPARGHHARGSPQPVLPPAVPPPLPTNAPATRRRRLCLRLRLAAPVPTTTAAPVPTPPPTTVIVPRRRRRRGAVTTLRRRRPRPSRAA